MALLKISTVEKNKNLMKVYFTITRIKIKHRIAEKIKGKTDSEKKQYVKENIATLCVLLDQLSIGGLGYKGQNFDGVLTYVLNTYKNINFKYKDWGEFYKSKPINEELGRKMMNELYKELEYALKNKRK